MTLNMGQWLSIPFILMGIGFVIYSFIHKPFKIRYPDKFPPENEPAYKIE